MVWYRKIEDVIDPEKAFMIHGLMVYLKLLRDLSVTPTHQGKENATKSLRKNRLTSRAFPSGELITLRSSCFSLFQRLRTPEFRCVALHAGAARTRSPGHTSGQPPVHAAAIAGLSRLPRRIRF
jgi:hypothetical protein